MSSGRATGLTGDTGGGVVTTTRTDVVDERDCAEEAAVEAEARAEAEGELEAERKGTDFTWRGGGSIFMLIPNTPSAEAWLDENTSDDSTWFGGGLAIEPRCAPAISVAIGEEGFTQD